MSRLGKKPLPLPEKVKAEVKADCIEIQGPLGKLLTKIHPHMNIKIENNQIIVSPKSDSTQDNMLHGLVWGMIRNALKDVVKGYNKNLEIQGLGYKALLEGNKLTLNLGFSHQINFVIPQGIKITVEKQTQISISGVDRVLVGETAARIRMLRPPEPYQGTGVRYKGEHIIRKAGKAAVGAGTGAK